MKERNTPPMNKIDHRHRYGIMLDTETANTIEDNGKLDMSNVLPYDIGFAVIDTYGRVYETFSFVNSDIFFQEEKLMKSAYYSHKRDQYLIDIMNGKRTVADTYNIQRTLKEVVKKYDCQFICAHNMRFDLTACNNAVRWETKSKYRYFFPYGVELWDTLKMARSVVGKMPTYRRFCEEHGYVTKNNQLRFTAEILYQFITKNTNFKEEHTGLEDVLIEIEILKYCKRQHKAMRKKLFNE